MIFENKLPPLPGLTCSYCGKSYKLGSRLKSHIESKHDISVVHSEDIKDDVVAHTILLTKLLLLRKNLHSAIKLGDGQRVVLTVKHMMPYFKANNSYKYALACLELIAQLEIFLSPKQCLAITQGRFVNQRGATDSNYAIDLCVEHSNKVFKENFSLYRGECTQQALDRVSKSQTVTKKILDNFQTEFGGREAHIGRHNVNAEKYENDVMMLYNMLEPYKLYVEKERIMRSSSLSSACKDPVRQLDIYSFQDWIAKRMNDMKTQTNLRRLTRSDDISS